MAKPPQFTRLAALLLLLPSLVSSQTFNLQDSFVGSQFFNAFEWNTFNDPTHGRVNYVSQSDAITMNLSYASGNTFVMKADDWSTLNSSDHSRGRSSVRISSLKAYADSVIVLDLQHMPEGCAAWPAFWTTSHKGPWPHGGEIDIIEGVNKQATNLATLHTTPQCTMPDKNSGMLGTYVSNYCDTSVNSNQGCGVSFPQQNSYGTGFNNAGGGWYVMKRTTADGVWVWFWTRNDPKVPNAVKYASPAGSRSGSTSTSTSTTIQPDASWGLPTARFVPDKCNMATHFDAHSIIFDLTFCGDWAGSAFASGGCGPQSCNDYVDSNPRAFSNAYWAVNALRVYTPD